MRSLSSPVLAAIYWLSNLALGVHAQEQQSEGYLAAVFKGDVPQVFFNLAPAATQSTFTALNDGKAVLVPTKGTAGARDPFIVKSQDGSKVCGGWIQRSIASLV